MHCIVCGAKLDPCFADEPVGGSASSPPVHATIFHAYGNFGSALFDRVSFNDNNTYLELYVCDMCLERKAELVNHCERAVMTEVKERPFAAVLQEEREN